MDPVTDLVSIIDSLGYHVLNNAAVARLVAHALAEAEQRGADAKHVELAYILEYARAMAVGTGNRDMVEACDFVLGDRPAFAARQGEESE